jgi:hypothetical protein
LEGDGEDPYPKQPVILPTPPLNPLLPDPFNP